MARALEALDEMVVDGIKTNIPLHKDLLTDPVEIKGGASIHYLEEKLELNNLQLLPSRKRKINQLLMNASVVKTEAFFL